MVGAVYGPEFYAGKGWELGRGLGEGLDGYSDLPAWEDAARGVPGQEAWPGRGGAGRGRAEAGRGVPGQEVWPGEAVVRLPALPPPLLLAVPLTRSPLRPPFLQ